MTPIQQMFLGVGAKKKTYMDDVFGNYLYKGTGSALTINNGIDESGEGALTWIKRRNSAQNHFLQDTVRGATKVLRCNTSEAESTESAAITAFNNNGFTLGTDTSVNSSGDNYSSFSFRKAPGFFDIVTYTGTGSNRTVGHSLGCVPGCIMIKRTDASGDWVVYTRGVGPGNALKLEGNGLAHGGTDRFNDTAPTASVFTVGTSSHVNTSGGAYVAYVFAGGESTAATARSVDFDGSNDYLSIADHADFDVGTNWTAECWFKCDAIGSNGWDVIFGQWADGWVLEYVGTDLRFYYASGYKSLGATPIGQWHHVAISKEGSTTRIFLNGTQVVADFDMGTTSSSNSFNIGGNMGGGANGPFNGQISNVRIVQGTAVYTSSFRPPTEPLTNITNTKLLCCNDSSQTGSTVTPGTITNNGSTASTDSPFDDPAAFTFGDAGDQNVIKCGSYVGDGGAGTTEINLGFEPQWLLVKTPDAYDNWVLLDSMRGFVTHDNQANDAGLYPNTTDAESTQGYLDLTSTGFKTTLYSNLNVSGRNYIYMAIRRPDGYVGKPIEDATKCFAMDTGANQIPVFDSGFPVDFALLKKTAGAEDWYPGARLIQGKFLSTNTTAAEGSNALWMFDSNVGWNNETGTFNSSDYQSWMFKRHAGMDVVVFKGNLVKHSIPHNLSKTPEMMWVKNRDHTYSWYVYHKGLNGGSSPQDYFVKLDTTAAESTTNGGWGNTAPTSTHFTVSDSEWTNGNDDKMLAMLFASVDGISKVGYYDGSDSAQTITTGFQPRFVIIKKASASGTNWVVLDTTRGWGSGDDKWLRLDHTGAQITYNLGEPTSTGFTLVGGSPTNSNISGSKFIYYAHA